MTHYTGNTTVGPGVYVSLHEPHIATLEARGRLPGGVATGWHRVPRAALLVLAPITGLVFVVFLPLLGIGLVVWIAIEMAARVLAPVASAGARVIRPAWEPALAYFGRGRRCVRSPSSIDKPSDEWAEEIEEELSDSD